MSRLDKVENVDVICHLFERKKFHCDGCTWYQEYECYLPVHMNMSFYHIHNLAYDLGEFLDVSTR